jgi:hypothetical protein
MTDNETDGYKHMYTAYLLPFPGVQLLTQDDSMNAGFLCDKAVVLIAFQPSDAM